MFSTDHNGGSGHSATPSPTFERLVTGLGLARRELQNRAVTIAHRAVTQNRRAIIQAPTGVGKSLVSLATAADFGRPGAPGIVATTTNSLGNQYLRDCHRAAEAGGFTFTRVMGAKHYVCADSPAARRAGVVCALDLESDSDEKRARRERDRWLETVTRTNTDPATKYERDPIGLGEDYACPGYEPDGTGCAGNWLGGCGSKKARARGFQVQVVVTNFHMLAYTSKTGLPLLPLEDASVVVIDEAHELPGVIAEIDGGQLTEKSTSRVLKNYPHVANAIMQMLTASLDRVPWPRRESPYDTEAPVPMDPATAEKAIAALQTLPADQLARMRKQKADDAGGFGPGDVLSLLNSWHQASSGNSTWRAWTTRRALTNKPLTWKESRTINIRRVDAAARVVPEMLPNAAVLLTGTVGATLPARCGLPHAEITYLEQAFDWSKVRGTISRYSGEKTRTPLAARRQRDAARVQELAAAISRHRGALVLANAAHDAKFVAEQLGLMLPQHFVFTPEVGGSIEAGKVKEEYEAHLNRGGRGVLVGVDSFATGLDLPGDLLTFVAWWVCVPSQSGYYDQAVSVHFSAHGNYLDERFRARFTQGIGRLLRSHQDWGEVMVCDSRGERHLLHGEFTPVDEHLGCINWAVASGGVAA